jgi:hypothetical protein
MFRALARECEGMEKEGAFAMLGDLCCVCMHNSKIKGSTHPLLPRHVIFCLDEIECSGSVL